MSRPTTKGFFVRERLIEAREARGLSQADIATLVDRSASTISKWESGDQAPDPAILENLAANLGVTTAYLVRQMPDYQSPSIFFRSLKAASARSRTRARARIGWMQTVSLALQEIVDFPSLNIPDLDIGDYRRIDDARLEEIATELRAFWNLGQGPIRSIGLVAENAGIVVGMDSAGVTKIDGESLWSPIDGRPYILLNDEKNCAFRRQMDIAHELAHIVLHKNVTPEQLDADFDRIEHQAKYLGSALLLPYKTFTSDILSLSLDSLLTLKPRWMVSVGAMVMRAHQLDLMSDEAATRLWKARAARGWHKREPMDDPRETAVENPRMLRRSIELIVDNGVRSKSDLIEYDLGISGSEVETIASLDRGYFYEPPANVVAPPKGFM